MIIYEEKHKFSDTFPILFQTLFYLNFKARGTLITPTPVSCAVEGLPSLVQKLPPFAL